MHLVRWFDCRWLLIIASLVLLTPGRVTDGTYHPGAPLVLSGLR